VVEDRHQALLDVGAQTLGLGLQVENRIGASSATVAAASGLPALFGISGGLLFCGLQNRQRRLEREGSVEYLGKNF